MQNTQDNLSQKTAQVGKHQDFLFKTIVHNNGQ